MEQRAEAEAEEWGLLLGAGAPLIVVAGMTAPSTTILEERAREESRRRRQERKKAQQRAFKTGVWGKCLYRVPGKERFCAQQRSVLL